jgi:uncharacterized protein YecE (DUF72 family)
MEFGKISHNLDAINFALPPSHPGSLKVLGEQKAQQVKVYVGCPIWSDNSFVGRIYPSHARPSNYVKYYAKQFNSIELNISHYKQLDPLTIQHWVELTSRDFKFFPKVQNLISHTPVLRQNADVMRDFLNNMKYFGNKLGMPFLQLPESYTSSKLNDLLTFLDDVAMNGFAIELRHQSWFNNASVLKQISNYFYKNDLTFLLLDTGGKREVIHQRLTSKTAFIRFLANDLHPTDYTRINDWVKQLTIWIENGLEEICFFVHTPTNALMPDIVTYFIKTLAKETGIKIEAPKLNIAAPIENKLF